MRISDWSSDVCSSDLIYPCCVSRSGDRQSRVAGCSAALVLSLWVQSRIRTAGTCGIRIWCGPICRERQAKIRCRSEEHKSELQSLMRISYAVFCLKKKKHITQPIDKSQHNTETP